MVNPTKESKQIMSACLQTLIDELHRNEVTEMNTIVTLGVYNKTKDTDTQVQWQVSVKQLEEPENE